MSENRIRVGRIGAAHGVRGDVRLKPFTDDPAAIAAYGPLRSEDGARRFEIEHWRPAGNVLIAKFRGIDDRNAAEALNGTWLTVPRAALPEPAEGEFYHADLIGLAAETPTGEALGAVVAVQDFGAGDLLEIARPGGASVYVPFTKAVVPVVDIAGGRVVIDPPEGLFEADEAGPSERA